MAKNSSRKPLTAKPSGLAHAARRRNPNPAAMANTPKITPLTAEIALLEVIAPITPATATSAPYSTIKLEAFIVPLEQSCHLAFMADETIDCERVLECVLDNF